MSAAGQSKPSKGQRFRPNAEFFGALVDVVRADQSRRLPQGPLDKVDLESLPLRIVNATGGTLGRFSVVCFGDVRVNPSSDAFKNQLVVEGIVPTEAKKHRFGIVQDGGVDGGVIECLASGVSQVRINVSDETHRYAQAVDGSTDALESCEYSSAEILWREGGTGEQWAIVRLGPRAVASNVNPCWGCWSLGGTGKVFQDGSSTPETDPYPIYPGGMWLHFGGVRSVARISNELGACFVVPTSGLDDVEPAVDIQQYGYYEVTIYTQWYLPPVTFSEAQIALQAASHDHTYTDNGVPMTTGLKAPEALALDAGGVATVNTELHLSGGGSHDMGLSSLPMYYTAASDPNRYAHHSATVVVASLASTLQGLRIKVWRSTATTYGVPRLGSCHLFIRQLYPFGADPI